MIANLEPYPAVKDSGIPGIGEIPEHWNLQRSKYVFRPVDVRSISGAEELLTVSSRYGVGPRANQDVTMFKAASYVGHKLCWPGDLVINSLWAWANGLGFSNHHGIVSTAYGVYRPISKDQVSGRFLNEALRSSAYQWQFQARSNGIWKSRLQLTDWSFLEMSLVLPPVPEQVGIVRYLDHVDRHVQRLVRTKRTLIELLAEQRQAVIHQAVTRGLDLNAPLKDSGVEWVGEIPEHWEVIRVKRLVTRIEQGISPQSEAMLAEGGSWGVLKSGCVNGGVFRERQHKRLPSSLRFDEGLAVVEGDVLISRACGSPRFVGSVGRVRSLNYQLILSDKTFRPVFNEPEIVDFVVWAMNSRYFRTQVELALSGAEGLANNLPLSGLKRLWVAVPPADEAV